jgi:hypothetical protein
MNCGGRRLITRLAQALAEYEQREVEERDFVLAAKLQPWIAGGSQPESLYQPAL